MGGVGLGVKSQGHKEVKGEACYRNFVSVYVGTTWGREGKNKNEKNPRVKSSLKSDLTQLQIWPAAFRSTTIRHSHWRALGLAYTLVSIATDLPITLCQ
jgi:hypothetical protein